MIDLLKKHVLWKWLVYIRSNVLTLIPDDLKTQEMCNEAVRIDPWLLYDVPDYLKTQKMCNKADDDCPWLLYDVPYRFRDLGMVIRATIHPLRVISPNHPRAQEVCERVVEKDPSHLTDVLGFFTTRKMCDKVVDSNPLQLEYVPKSL